MENSESYKKRVKLHTPPSSLLKDCFFAFLFGGTICLIGEVLAGVYQNLVSSEKDAYTLVTVTLNFIAALLTGLGVFDNIARYAGAGTLVPVTGFANSVVSPAIDNKSEGLILGVGAKMLKIARPIIVYGAVASVIYGVVYRVTTLF